MRILRICARREGENFLAVACSNEYKDSVYPQSADLILWRTLSRCELDLRAGRHILIWNIMEVLDFR